MSSIRKISKQKLHLGESKVQVLNISHCFKHCCCRKEMEATWNKKGEDYKSQVEQIEEKLRNTELAVSKVINDY